MSISPLNHMPSIYYTEKPPIHTCAKQIFFSPAALNTFLGVQGFLLLVCHLFLLPASAQIVTTRTGITVNVATAATAGSPGAIALGSAASSSGINAISIGIGAAASGVRSVAIGPQLGGETTNAIGNRSIALGTGAQAENDFSTAFGANAIASGARTIAIGIKSKSLADSAITIGENAEASASAINAISIGNESKALGNRAVALGGGAEAGEFATALGNKANASGFAAVAIGRSSDALFESATAIGQNAQALQTKATALGSAAKATGEQATAIGNNAQASGEKASAFGFAANADRIGSTAIGANSEARGNFSTSLGAQSQAIAPFSTAIGLNAIATKPNQIVIGTNISRLTVPSLGNGGSFLGASNQNGSTRLLSTDGEGNLGTSSISTSQIERIPAIETALSKIGTAMNAGTSIALALSAVPTVSEDPREAIRCGIGTGGYGGTYAVGLGCAAKVFDRVQINGGLSFAPPVDYGYGTTPKVGGRIGFSFPLGVSSQSSRNSAAASASTITGTSDSNTRAVIEQLRNDLDQQKQITLKLQKQLQSLLAKTKS